MKVNNSYLNKTVNKWLRSQLEGALRNAQPFFTVWHETASSSREANSSPNGTLDYNLTNPPGTSYTGLIARDGTYYPYTSREYISYHAGVNSFWLGHRGFECNVYGDGFELDGPNNGLPITAAQRQTVVEIALMQWEQKGIPLSNLYNPEHEQVAPTDPQGRIYKTDVRGADIAAIINPLGLSVFAPARMSLQQFGAVLAKHSSPAKGQAEQLYKICLEQGFDPAVALAFFVHESRCGTQGIAANFDTKNWGNVRTPYDKERATLIQTGGGNFAKFRDWADGLIDFIERLKYWYQRDKGAWTVELIIPTYAPSSDGNNPASYIRAVRSLVKQWEQDRIQLAPVPSTSGEALIPASVQAYWVASGGIWAANRYALGLFISEVQEPTEPGNKLYLFERGALRLKEAGSIDALLLPEAAAIMAP